MQKLRPIGRHAVIYALPAEFVHPQGLKKTPTRLSMRGRFYLAYIIHRGKPSSILLHWHKAFSNFARVGPWSVQRVAASLLGFGKSLASDGHGGGSAGVGLPAANGDVDIERVELDGARPAPALVRGQNCGARP
jgi:hypothetical protein